MFLLHRSSSSLRAGGPAALPFQAELGGCRILFNVAIPTVRGFYRNSAVGSVETLSSTQIGAGAAAPCSGCCNAATRLECVAPSLRLA